MALDLSLRVIKRDGRLVHFNAMCIETAIKNAFLSQKPLVQEDMAALQIQVCELTQRVVHDIQKKYAAGSSLPIEDIQDRVELILMRSGEHKVARAYVLYREEHSKMREAHSVQTPMQLIVSEKNQVPLDRASVDALLHKACAGRFNVDPFVIYDEVKRYLFDKMTYADLYQALIVSTRALIEVEPNYSWVAAHLLLQSMYAPTLNALGLHFDTYTWSPNVTTLYRQSLQAFIEYGTEHLLLDPRLKTLYHIDELSQALDLERDRKFQYLGLQTLYDRYFIHHNQVRLELPQIFWMRVAMGLALNEAEPTKRCIEFYNVLSSFDFMCSTPTLFHAGTTYAQLSSCYLSTVEDDLGCIFDVYKENALLAKHAGGLANDWTPIRAAGSTILGTNGVSQGVIPFLKVADSTAVAVDQSGKRKGAVCAYLETWHLDIEEFLMLKKNTGDDRRRTHDMNTANWIPDLFMERVVRQEPWTLFSPCDVPDLHDLYGINFKIAYEAYEMQAQLGHIRHKTISALDLWRKMLGMLFETGHPWMTFKDPCNLRSPQQHIGVVHSSNLCTEITLNTSKEEIAVCNLGSVNLAQHILNGGLDTAKIKKTVHTAVRILDNVIDLNYYSVKKAKRSNLKHRPIGLGLMGFQDALYQLRLSYASKAAVDFADHSMECISYEAIQASIELARERGIYETFTGSLWDQGILPIDSIQRVQALRSQFLQDVSSTLDWSALRSLLKKHGIRNSNLMAIAPTATIANICGISASIEPTFRNLFVKSNLSGEFTMVNPYLIEDLKSLNLWDKAMAYDLKYHDGSVQIIDRIPQSLKDLYKTAFEIDQIHLIECASRRQKWIDQAQSLNLYVREVSGKKLDALYKAAWLFGLKTTYYLRTQGASSTEKATIDTRSLNAVSACNMDEGCEVCQ